MPPSRRPQGAAEAALFSAIFGAPEAPESAQTIFRREAEAKLRAEGKLPPPGTPDGQMPVLPLPDGQGDIYQTALVWRFVPGDSAEDAIFAHAGSGMAVDEPDTYRLVWEPDFRAKAPAAPGYSAAAYSALTRDRAAALRERAAVQRQRELDRAAQRRHLVANKAELYQLFHPYYQDAIGEAVEMTASEAKARNREREKLPGTEGEYVWTARHGMSH